MLHSEQCDYHTGSRYYFKSRSGEESDYLRADFHPPASPEERCMTEDERPISIGFIGAGPRAIGIIERIVANAASIAGDRPLEIVTIDPYPAGPGRIWRYDQSPSLRMNSLAEDVAIFADETCRIEGPLVTGPTLAEWAACVQRGEIAFTPPDAQVAAELAGFGPQSFATRRFFSGYLRWYYDHVRSLAPATIAIAEVTGAVTAVRERGERFDLIVADAEGRREIRTVDLVVYAVGHTDAEPSPEERALLAQAEACGLAYWPSHYASEADFDAIPPGEAVVLRGLGLSFIDIVVRLTLDRGGQQTYDPAAPAGFRSTYRPSGREPRIVAGSGRGVPYHAKITSHLHGEQPGFATTFLTRESLQAILDGNTEVDFHRDVWPSVIREMAYWHYREIFTGHPTRVRWPWARFSAVFHREPYGSDALNAAIREAVAPEDIFDIDALDRPLAGVREASLAALQERLAASIQRDIHLREAEEHSETQALFIAILACYGVIAESLAHPAWSIDSRLRAIPHWWHHFFSYVDSGPPSIRLELLLALMRAGLLTFVGAETRVAIDAEAGTFVATGANHPERIAARFLVDAFHPERTIARSADPVLRDLVESGAGAEQVLLGPGGPVSTRRLAVDFARGNVVRPDGIPHGRRFAVGDFTSGPPSAAFSRPRTNALVFRENDAIARHLLHAAVDVSASRTPAIPSPAR